MDEYRDAVLKALAADREPFPDAAGVWVRRPTVAGLRDLCRWREKNRDRGFRFLAQTMSVCVVDDDGRPVLTADEAAGLPAPVFEAVSRQLESLTGGTVAPPPGPAVAPPGPAPLPGLVPFVAGRASVLLRRLTEADLRAYRRTFGRGGDHWRAAVWGVARSIVGPAGTRLFTEADVFDLDAGAVDAIGGRVASLNHL